MVQTGWGRRKELPSLCELRNAVEKFVKHWFKPRYAINAQSIQREADGTIKYI